MSSISGTKEGVRLEIRFYCESNGKKFYKVIVHGEEIFCGTKGECQRFIKIHNQKVARALASPDTDRRSRSGAREHRRVLAGVILQADRIADVV